MDTDSRQYRPEQSLQEDLAATNVTAISSLLIRHSTLAFQLAVGAFMVLMIILAMIMPITVSTLVVTLGSSLIYLLIITYLRRSVLPVYPVRAAHITTLLTLVFGCMIGYMTQSMTIVVLAILILAITSLPSENIYFFVLLGSLSFSIYVGSLFLLPQVNPVDDMFLGLPEVYGRPINWFLLFLGLGAITGFIIRVMQLFQRSIVTAQQLVQDNEQLRTVEKQANDVLQQRIHEQDRLIEIVRTLEVPTIRLMDGMLLVPLIGSPDTARMQAIQERILAVMNAQQVRTVILELSSMTFMDTHTLSQLIQLSRAINLLGSKTVLVGMQSSIASTLVKMGADIDQISSYATIQDVLQQHLKPTYTL